MAQATAFFKDAPHTHQLKQHFDSFLALLRRARSQAVYHQAYIQLLTTLHPSPLRWGHWDVWEQELEAAIPMLAAYGQATKQAELMNYLAGIQFRTGRLETAVHTSRQTLELAWANRAIIPWATAGNRLVLTISRLGRTEEARKLLTQLEKQLDEAPFVKDEAERLQASGHLLLRRMVFLRHDGRAPAAAQQCQILIDKLLALPQIDRHLLATLYTDRATMLWASDQYEPAVDALQEAIAIYVELGDMYEETATRGNLGIVYWSMARLSEAEAAIRSSLQMAESLNARWRMMNEIGNLCAICLSQGKLEKGLQYTERHLVLALEADDAAEIDRAHGNRSVALLYLGQYAAALPIIEASIKQLQEMGLQPILAESYVHLSYCLFGLGQRAKAEAALAKGMELASRIDSPVLEGMLLRCRALLAPHAEAVDLMEQALALARRYRRPLDEGRCLLRLSVLASGDRQDELWQQGAAILRQIGAEAWLDGRNPSNPPALAMVL